MPITTEVVSLNPVHGEVYSIQHYVINLSITCVRSVIFSGFSGFLHQLNWPPRYNWNIVEGGVKHLKPTKPTNLHFFDISDFTVGDNGNLYTNTDFVDRQGPIRFKVQVTDSNHVSSNNKEALVIIYVSIVSSKLFCDEPKIWCEMAKNMYRILRTIGRYFFSSTRWLRPLVHIDLYKDEVKKIWNP